MVINSRPIHLDNNYLKIMYSSQKEISLMKELQEKDYKIHD